ncbi:MULTISPECIES: TIGR03564 family F420-dependent LLM class oxidoreductase [unclassified Frankia]|uniref:TIGR03564 family F420-dependent LLM class oxidoreductase n=1 Tax=unclassified Frankia TaxID=2632575 RepID=UPI00200C35CA|nr:MULTISPECIES: TIGR03564 family F420-dependent LLM class oxidoreductase [unclassified Frankia]MCK9896341.1 TIGR03564 family F420-dependent LLM class oxidoreductase [Frankia sp. AgB32]MCL9793242.1 TIGR03564 family F420-dependent LLM class oxidoreductase [Frankia sp. AgKG'84/4]
MRLGMSLASGNRPLSAFLDQISHHEEAGLDTVWCSQLFGIDALTVFALAGARTTRISFGTAIIPTYSRHPLQLASAALTTQAATGNRLTLGIGSSHRALVTDALGLDYQRPAAYLREYLSVLPGLLRGERLSHRGELLNVDTTGTFGPPQVVGAEAPPVLVGTMFPISLKIAGTFADGIVTWLVGPRALADEVIPTVRAAAAAAGRPQPRVVAGIPAAVCASADAAGHRDLINRRLAGFTALPVYQQVLAREQVTEPADLAAVGDEEAVAARLAAYAEVGVDEVHGICFGDDATLFRTAEFFGDRARANARTASPV